MNRMDMESTNKRPLTFTIFGYLSIIAGIILIAQSSLVIWWFHSSYKHLSPELTKLISLPFQIILLGTPILLSILYFIEGLGFLKLKVWMPKLLLITLIIGFILQAIACFDSIIFIINPAEAVFEYFVKDGVSLWIGVLFVWFVFKNKFLFVN